MHDPKEIADRFDAILKTYYKAWFRFHPEVAVEAGHDAYADRLTPYGDDDIGALITLKNWIAKCLMPTAWSIMSWPGVVLVWRLSCYWKLTGVIVILSATCQSMLCTSC